MTRLRSRATRLIAVVAVTGAAATTAALVPASASSTLPPPVQGGDVQAWQATAYRPAAPVKAPTIDYYFTGTPSDQVDKLTGENPAGFSRSAPKESQDASQNAEGGLDDGTPTSAATAFWSAPFTGSIAGRVTMTWWWQTLDPLSAGLNAPALQVRVWADPGTPQQKLIGTKDVVMDAFGPGPSEEKAAVDIKGAVAKRLLVQAVSLNSDAGHGFRVFYGSTAHPSRFSVPTGATVVAKQPFPSTKHVRDTNPLVLSATSIGRKAAEPTIGITKQGNAFYAAATFDTPGGSLARTKIYASYDGNRSWRDVSPQVLGESFPPATLDPYIYVDTETGRVFSDDLTAACSVLQWSDDQGKSWVQGTPAACEMPVDDHQTIVTGNPPPGVTTNGYPNVLYYCVNKVADAQCARSLDGGRTFLPTGAPAFAGAQEAQDGSGSTAPGFCGSLHGHIVTDAAGRLYLPKGHCTRPWLAVSEDGGLTWRQTLVNRMAVAGTQTSVAVDKAGNVYYLWWDAENKLPYLAVSRDAGKTFGPAMLVAPPGVRSVNFPSIDAGAAGHVSISYPGTTDPDPTKPSRAWNYYVAVTDNALAAKPVFHSATANPVKDPVYRGVCLGRCGNMLDFLDVVVAPGNATWATMVDTCTGRCVSVDGPKLAAAQGPEDQQGIAIRQLSGPGLRRR